MEKCIAIFLFLPPHAGYKKIGEQIVIHQARQFGKTKFGVDRFFKGFLGLNYPVGLSTRFLEETPCTFFGLLGTLLLFVGFVFTAFLGIDKLYLDTTGRLITSKT